MGNIYTGSNSGKAGLNVKKADNTVDVFGVNQIQLGGNMTLVNNQNGSVTIDSTGGGGSGGVTELSFGGTGLTPAGATTGSITVAGTLNVTSGGTGADNAADARSKSWCRDYEQELQLPITLNYHYCRQQWDYEFFYTNR